jgi:hypothetical protein
VSFPGLDCRVPLVPELSARQGRPSSVPALYAPCVRARRSDGLGASPADSRTVCSRTGNRQSRAAFRKHGVARQFMNVPANAGRLSATMPLAVLAITDRSYHCTFVRDGSAGCSRATRRSSGSTTRFNAGQPGPPVVQVCLRAYEMAAVSEGLAITLHRRRWRRRYGIREFCR